jgi:hypothetical protein
MPRPRAGLLLALDFSTRRRSELAGRRRNVLDLAAVDPSEECCICCEPLRGPGALPCSRAPRCGHFFHTECITNARDGHGFHQCPLCRTELGPLVGGGAGVASGILRGFGFGIGNPGGGGVADSGDDLQGGYLGMSDLSADARFLRRWGSAHEARRERVRLLCLVEVAVPLIAGLERDHRPAFAASSSSSSSTSSSSTTATTSRPCAA